MVRRNGFTLIELLVVLAIILLLVGIIAPAMSPVMEMARRQKCAANLKKIVADMRTYAPSNNEFFPSAYNDTDDTGTALPGMYLNYVGVDYQKDPTSTVAANKAVPAAVGPSRSLYLLVHGKLSTLEAFICPSTDHNAKPLDNTQTVIPNPALDFDFYTGRQLSYSYQSHRNLGAGQYWPPSMTSPSDLVMMADRNPVIGNESGTSSTGGWAPTYKMWYARLDNILPNSAGTISGNSFNHMASDGIKGDGQNVATSDSSVRWTTTPNCGSRQWLYSGAPVGDNIWSWGDAASGVAQSSPAAAAYYTSSPTHAGDSFLR
ncbi:MAG: prepilin-type N-terminal cleavage/methylation domain-containing protein [Planctomycetota bacterium]|nr:prepilin-type N-terminal cleavage/methylation domain-containing protein [Planctomycetota bacterium]